MRKKLKNLKKILIIILIVMTVISIYIPTFATSGLDKARNDGFDSNDKTPENVNNLISNSTSTVVTIARIVSATIAIVMILTVSMKYMTSSAGDRADIKKHAIVYVVGALIIFSVPGILKILLDISKSIKLE